MYSEENSAGDGWWLAGEVGCRPESSENPSDACFGRTALANRQTFRGRHSRYYLPRKSEFRVKMGWDLKKAGGFFGRRRWFW
jgi:hypothetical protein